MKYESRNPEKTIIAKIEDDGHVIIVEAGSPDFEEAKALAEPYTPPSSEEVFAEQAAKVRAKRTALLSESDWTQLPDAPVDQTAWAAYRQALRDITSQEGFPTDVVWPVKPE